MASIYTRPKSRFWWVKYRDAQTGKIMRESTGVDVALPGAKRKAQAVEARHTQAELSVPRHSRSERFDEWADGYFRKRYAGHDSTLANALISLRKILEFCAAKLILTPRQMSYEHAGNFVPWLKDQGLHHNTARLRFIYLSVLLGEAVRRGMIEYNPCREVKPGSVPAKQKLEISAEDELTIQAALLEKKQWMREQWLVLMRHGCRIAETEVPLSRIEETARAITFRLKGGKLHTARLHTDLLPLIAVARAEGRSTLIMGSPNASQIWTMFFKELALPYSIHCTRVTVITRLLRAGHSPAVVAAFIGHTEEVNVIYRRLKPADTQALLDTLGAAPSP